MPCPGKEQGGRPRKVGWQAGTGRPGKRQTVLNAHCLGTRARHCGAGGPRGQLSTNKPCLFLLLGPHRVVSSNRWALLLLSTCAKSCPSHLFRHVPHTCSEGLPLTQPPLRHTKVNIVLFALHVFLSPLWLKQLLASNNCVLGCVCGGVPHRFKLGDSLEGLTRQTRQQVLFTAEVFLA